MNIWDIILIVIIVAAVTLAVMHIIRTKRSGGCTCGGSCAGCSTPCQKGKNEQ